MILIPLYCNNTHTLRYQGSIDSVVALVRRQIIRRQVSKTKAIMH